MSFSFHRQNGSLDVLKARVADLNALTIPPNTDIVVAPTALHLFLLREQLRADIAVGAQNCYVKTGAFTGEISSDMLKDAGVPWVILGHSERRSLFGETDDVVAAKVAAALHSGLSVIACIGETLTERNEGRLKDVLQRQVLAIVKAVPASAWPRVVIAYEPVWAIGTGVVATPQQAQEAHELVRRLIADAASADVAAAVRIIYGGSVKANNCMELAHAADIDGFLVGGASLTSEFVDICKAGFAKLH